MADSDDPFLPSDLTARPRPGAGKRGMPDSGMYQRPATPRVAEVEPIPESARALLGLGLNPLVQAASPLLLRIGQMRSAPASLDVAEPPPRARSKRFAGSRSRRAPPACATKSCSRRATCCARRWTKRCSRRRAGSQSEWAQHPLLVALHREAWGGEKFFEMLDRIVVDPARHIDLIELQYLVLALGFTGKYQMLDRGHEQLDDLQHGPLPHDSRTSAGPATPDLSLHWRGLEDQRNRLIRYVPWWVVVAAALADARRRRSPLLLEARRHRRSRCRPGWRRSGSKTSPCLRRRRPAPGRRSSSCWRRKKRPAR